MSDVGWPVIVVMVTDSVSELRIPAMMKNVLCCHDKHTSISDGSQLHGAQGSHSSP